ncbi:MAG: hypothetical protein V7707_19895 [Motiliproteus sp.]
MIAVTQEDSDVVKKHLQVALSALGMKAINPAEHFLQVGFSTSIASRSDSATRIE